MSLTLTECAVDLLHDTNRETINTPFDNHNVLFGEHRENAQKHALYRPNKTDSQRRTDIAATFQLKVAIMIREHLWSRTAQSSISPTAELSGSKLEGWMMR